MEPPHAVAADKRRASYHFTLALDDVRLADASNGGGLDRCHASGVVEKVHRRPWLRRDREELRPRKGARISIRIAGFDATKGGVEPAGPSRVHYGEGVALDRIEVWASVVAGALVALQFEALDSNAGRPLDPR